MPTYTTPIPAGGPEGNIFLIVGLACRWLRELGHPPDEIAGFRRRVLHASSYDTAVAIVEERFPVNRSGRA